MGRQWRQALGMHCDPGCSDFQWRHDRPGSRDSASSGRTRPRGERRRRPARGACLPRCQEGPRSSAASARHYEPSNWGRGEGGVVLHPPQEPAIRKLSSRILLQTPMWQFQDTAAAAIDPKPGPRLADSQPESLSSRSPASVGQATAPEGHPGAGLSVPDRHAHSRPSAVWLMLPGHALPPRRRSASFFSPHPPHP